MANEAKAPLPNDVSRCLDDGCPQHETCRRWLDRDTGEGEWVCQCASLYPYDQPLGEPCPLYIPSEGDH